MRPVRAVIRAIRVLDLLAQAAGPVRISSIARELGLPRSTAYDLLGTLASCDVVQISDEGTVSLGLRVFEFGSAYARSMDLMSEGRDVAAELTRQCNETTHVAVLDGLDVVYLVKQESEHMVRLVSAVGRRVPAHATAVGKVQLAALSEVELHRRFSGVQLDKMTPNTITDFEALKVELAETASRGYAIDNQESSHEVCCVAALVRGDQGRSIAGVSISVPVSRWSSSRRIELGRAVMHAASRFSRRMGYIEGKELDVEDAGTRDTSLGISPVERVRDGLAQVSDRDR